MSTERLALDEGVLASGTLCELQGWRASRARAGICVLPWRHAWLEARAAGLDPLPNADSLEDGSFDQCLVHLQKSRDATWQDLATAWRLLAPAGRLLLCGGNDLGVVSAVKRLAGELAQRPRIVANRARARIALFTRDAGPGPPHPSAGRLELPVVGAAPTAAQPARVPLVTTPGVFSARKLDAGTRVLIEQLADLRAPVRVLDLACGVGPLALSSLLRWPEATAVGLDGDARAIDCARQNAARLGLAARVEFAWWDASEPLPGGSFDLVLLNPPFHTGKGVDLDPARKLFERLGEAIGPRGLGLVVANRTLPYEAELRRIGPLEHLAYASGYKLIAVSRSRRSLSSSSRRPPTSRSAGSS